MRTLNDITPPSRRREVEPLSKTMASNRMYEQSPKFPYVTLLTIILVIAASISALFYFSSTKVIVTPNTVSAAIESSFSAQESGGALPYEIITAQKIATQSVKGSGTKTVTTSASGTITIYNAQTNSQKLITNTRFATTAGLIFRIHSGVTIPGGSTAKPGSITAKVYADQAGTSYNIPPTSFTIPGFAGTPQESLVYARSQEAMTGGASGNVPVIDASLEAQTRDALAKALIPDLLAALQTQIPEGYILINGAATTTFQGLDSTPSETTGQINVKEQGTITAVVFPNAALAKAVANSVTGLNYHDEPLSLTSSSTLFLTASSLPKPEAASFSFVLSGTASLVYTVDPTRIAAAVSGKTKAAAEVALTSYPEIKRAVIVLRPFWRQVFPQDPASITVEVANP